MSPFPGGQGIPEAEYWDSGCRKVLTTALGTRPCSLHLLGKLELQGPPRGCGEGLRWGCCLSRLLQIFLADSHLGKIGIEDSYTKSTAPNAPRPTPRQIDGQTQAHAFTLHSDMVLGLISELLHKGLLTLSSTSLCARFGGRASEKKCGTGRRRVSVLSGQRRPVEKIFCMCSFNKQELSCFCVLGIALGTSVI